MGWEAYEADMFVRVAAWWRRAFMVWLWQVRQGTSSTCGAKTVLDSALS